MSRKAGIVITFIAGALLVPVAAFAQENGEGSKPTRKVAPRISAVKSEPAPRLPAPIVEPLAVTIVGNPVDDTGHLIVNDHPHGAKLVEVTNLQRVYEFVGFTSVETLPNIGVFGMSRLCAAEIPGSRMCTLDEALDTADPPTSPSYVPAGWLRDDAFSRQPAPVKMPAEPLPDPGSPTLPTLQNNQCWGWSSTEGWATTLSSEGAVGGRFCHELAPVACCRPKG